MEQHIPCVHNIAVATAIVSMLRPTLPDAVNFLGPRVDFCAIKNFTGHVASRYKEWVGGWGGGGGGGGHYNMHATGQSKLFLARWPWLCLFNHFTLDSGSYVRLRGLP